MLVEKQAHPESEPASKTLVRRFVKVDCVQQAEYNAKSKSHYGLITIREKCLLRNKNKYYGHDQRAYIIASQ